MQRALSSLATVLADPAAPGAAEALTALRARWRELAPEERDALTPLARLASARVRAAQAARPASAPDADDDGMLAYLDSLGGPVEEEDPGRFDAAAAAPPAFDPGPPARAAAPRPGAPAAEQTLFGA
ncbi:ATP-dependent DNA helicase RecQ, partial [Conexibacter stalactiti]|nr:ATP-dependent DNA helicase RecQ [Conexibacter stalactiti]MEC5038700.1 ATP-dependent DNA helicase RecQ [Conexibacter stalactiti]